MILTQRPLERVLFRTPAHPSPILEATQERYLLEHLFTRGFDVDHGTVRSEADPAPRALGIFWSVIAQECPMVSESIEPARWGEPVSDRAIATTEGHLHAQLPPAWRAYLQSQRWLRRGWLESGDYIHLYDPEESLEIMDAWGDSTALHPGIYFLGGDGSRSIYCVDLRDAEPAVQLTDIVGGGWMDAEPLLDSVEQFVAAISDGTFRAFQEG